MKTLATRIRQPVSLQPRCYSVCEVLSRGALYFTRRALTHFHVAGFVKIRPKDVGFCLPTEFSRIRLRVTLATACALAALCAANCPVAKVVAENPANIQIRHEIAEASPIDDGNCIQNELLRGSQVAAWSQSANPTTAFEVVSAAVINPTEAPALAGASQNNPNLTNPKQSNPAHGRPNQVNPYVGGPEIACRAAQRWLPATLLRQRAKTIVDAYCDQDDCLRQSAASIATFLRLQANSQEDIGAAVALRAYYTRVGISQQLRLLAETDRLFEQQRLTLQALIDKGLGSVENDPSELSRRLLELADQRIVAQTSESQLRSALYQLSGKDFSADETTLEPLEVRAQSLDCDRLCAFAVEHRHDLRAWGYLCGRVDETSAEMIAQTVAPMLGGFNLSLPQRCLLELLLRRTDENGLSRNIAAEVSAACQLQRQAIERSVRDKCHALHSAYQRIELADKIVASLDDRIARLERLAELGNSQPVKLFEARSQLSQAKSNALKRRNEAKLAEIDLSEAVGGLAIRCCSGQPWLVTGGNR